MENKANSALPAGAGAGTWAELGNYCYFVTFANLFLILTV